jgi:hypothetical protein
MTTLRPPLLAFSLALLPACASESLPEPEPTLVTPGAFVAEAPDDGPLLLFRTLETFATEGDTIVAFTEYDVSPANWEQAEFFARLPDLPIRIALTAASANLFSQGEYRVVWYRTLTDEERERAE